MALAGAAASLAAAFLAPGVRAQDDPEDVVLPDSFAGRATASALDVTVLTPAIVPVPNLFDLGVVRGDSTYESAKQESRASLLFPGNGVVMGPNLVCGTFIGPQIPESADAFIGPILDACNGIRYPLSVEADSVLHPDVTTEGALSLGEDSDPISLGAIGATAHAAADGTRTEAQVADLRVLGLPALGAITPLLELLKLPIPDATLLRIDGLTARTDQRIQGDQLVVDAEATVAGVRILGGLVRIGSITSRSHLATGGTGDPLLSSTTEIAGVEVAGIPARITDQGLILGDPNRPLGPLLQQLTSSLANVLQGVGLTIATLPTEQGDENGIPFARSSGLTIEFTTPLAGLPPLSIPGLGDADLNGDYGIRIQIGSSGVKGFADTFGGDDDGSSDTTRPPSSSGGSGSGGSTGTPSRGNTGGGTGVTTSPTRAAAPTTAPVGGEEPVTEPAGAFDDGGFADRMALLYLSFTLAALALCLSPRLTLPARFGGAAHG